MHTCFYLKNIQILLYIFYITRFPYCICNYFILYLKINNFYFQKLLLILLQDVVLAIANATAQTGRFILVERWRTNERLLAPYEKPLKVRYALYHIYIMKICILQYQ